MIHGNCDSPMWNLGNASLQAQAPDDLAARACWQPPTRGPAPITATSKSQVLCIFEPKAGEILSRQCVRSPARSLLPAKALSMRSRASSSSARPRPWWFTPGRPSTFGDVYTLAQDVSDRVATCGYGSSVARWSVLRPAAGSLPCRLAGPAPPRHRRVAARIRSPPSRHRRLVARSMARERRAGLRGWTAVVEDCRLSHPQNLRPPVATRSRADVAIVK